MYTLQQFVVISALITLSARGILAANLSPSTLDITRPCETLPVATAQSTPTETRTVIQSRLDYLDARNMRGRVYLPSGEWQIDKPLFMIGENKELTGAGIGKTILRAADGYRGMPMVNMNVRSYQPERPFHSANRPALTGVLDASIPGIRYGVRTYTEYPCTRFPRESHINVPAPKNIPGWADGAQYKLNDMVLLHPLNSQRGIDAVCVQAHAASKDNQPYAGAHWMEYWVLRQPFNIQFVGDPLAAGPYELTTKRATNWAGMSKFTLDFAFSMNADPTIYRDQWRPLCGVLTHDAWQWQNRTWMVALRGDGALEFDLTTAAGIPKTYILTPCKYSGLYRLSVQVDFTSHTVQAWVRPPDAQEFTRTVNDASLPAGTSFKQSEYGFCCLAAGDSGNLPCDNGNCEPPTDITVSGLHTANVLRYADLPTLRRRTGDGAADDAYRYFTNDHGTLAFLPLTDCPADTEMTTVGRLITVQHGDAAGDAQQKGFGYLNVPACTCGIGGQRVSEMTIVPGPTWGVGIVTWNLIDSKIWNLDLRGGYYAIGDLFMGAQYTYDIRDCLLSGSEAAYNGMSNIAYLRNVTINPVGRCGLLLSGSNCVLDNVRFIDPQTHRSEYYVRHIFSTIYGGMNSYAHVTALASPGCAFPSKAAFSMQNIWVYRTSMILHDCHIANMGPDAAFLNLDFYNSEGRGTISLDQCTYAGTPIASFIRTDSPWWSGPISDWNPKTPVKKPVDQLPPPFSGWEAKRNYTPGSLLTVAGQAYKCTVAHVALPVNRPGTPEGAKVWLPVASLFTFSETAR